MTMIWATPAEVREVVNAHRAALGDEEWPPLPEADASVEVLITSAGRALGAKAVRWPVLDDDDRAEDTEQRGHLVLAVAEVIRARLREIRRAERAATAAGGAALADLVGAGGKIKAASLEVQGAAGGVGGATRPIPLPLDAVWALQAAGLIGGSVPTW